MTLLHDQLWEMSTDFKILVFSEIIFNFEVIQLLSNVKIYIIYIKLYAFGTAVFTRKTVVPISYYGCMITLSTIIYLSVRI